MRLKTVTKEHFEQVSARLSEVLVIGKAQLKIGKGIRDAVTSDPALIQVCRVFWGTTITAHLEAAQIAAFKLFDSRAGSMSIRYLLELAGRLHDSFRGADAEQVGRIIRAAEQKIASCSALEALNSKRNRILAHLDPTIVSDPARLAKATQVTFGDLESIFGTAGEILNELSVAYRDASSIFELMDDEDFTWAIQLIADAKHEQADRYEREFGTPAPFGRPRQAKSYN